MDYSYIYIENIELDQNAISSANSASQFNAGDSRAKDAENIFNKFATQFPIYGELSIRQVEYLAERQTNWAELVTTAYNDILRRCVPVTIAGLSNDNPDKGGRLAGGEQTVSTEWHWKMECFLENTRKTLDELTPLDKQLESIRNGEMRFGEAISSDDKNAVLKLRAKLVYLQENQNTMKAVNSYYRKYKTLDGCTDISRKTAAELYNKMKTRSRRIEAEPFESYMLQNNKAEILNVKRKIIELQKQQSTEAKRNNCAS